MPNTSPHWHLAASSISAGCGRWLPLQVGHVCLLAAADLVPADLAVLTPSSKCLHSAISYAIVNIFTRDVLHEPGSLPPCGDGAPTDTGRLSSTRFS